MPSRKEAKAKSKLVSGEALLAVIAITDGLIKWLDIRGNLVGHVDPTRATAIVKGGTYTGKCSPRRAIYIKEMDMRRHNCRGAFVADPYRDGYYLGEGKAMIAAVPVTSKTVDFWDEHFERYPDAK